MRTLIRTILKKQLAILTVLAALGILIGCASSNSETTFTVEHNNTELIGDLTLPSGKGPHPAIIFVHGDGAMPADVYGYYQPLKVAFANAGFATLSLDKPGVDRSSGDWLAQSMQDRADEVIATAQALKQHPEINSDYIGLWGVSQAGWVMPLAVSQSSEFVFMISVSPAVNWIRQGKYLTRNRMRLEGYDESEIEFALEFEEQIDDLLTSDASYESYLEAMGTAPPCCSAAMGRARWQFVRRNINADAVAGLRRTKIPVLALFGDKDLNVDFEESAHVYDKELAYAENPDVTIKVFKDADHSLYPAREARLSGTGMMDAWRVFKVSIFGAGAFAPDYIDGTVKWAAERYQKTK